MGDQQQGGRGLAERLAEGLLGGAAAVGVQVHQGFVQEQERGLGSQGPGQGDAPRLAARELGGMATAQGGDLQQGEGPGGAVGCLRGGEVGHGEGHVLPHGQVRPQERLLEDHGQPALRGGKAETLPPEPPVPEPDGAAVRLLEARKAAQERALAAARGAQDGQGGARGEREVHAFQYGEAAIALAEAADLQGLGVHGFILQRVLRRTAPTARAAAVPERAESRMDRAATSGPAP